MNNELLKSDCIKNIGQALIEFHKRIGKIKKDANNPFFKSKYASLSNILDNVDTPLDESGLAYAQFPTGDNGLTTILIHATSGEYMQSTYNMHPVKNDPQSTGSAITYARRYALGAILGLNIDEDDDGNAASQPDKQKAKSAPSDKAWLNENTKAWTDVVAFLVGGGTMDKVKLKYLISKDNEKKLIEATLQTA